MIRLGRGRWTFHADHSLEFPKLRPALVLIRFPARSRLHGQKTVAVEVDNVGNADLVSAFTITVFGDLDGDGVFTSGTDNSLGETVFAAGVVQTSFTVPAWVAGFSGRPGFLI